MFKDQTIVAVEKVRHVGDPVAAVAALDPDAAEEALRLIEVEYEELPAVLDVHQALKPGGPWSMSRFAYLNPDLPILPSSSR